MKSNILLIFMFLLFQAPNKVSACTGGIFCSLGGTFSPYSVAKLIEGEISIYYRGVFRASTTIVTTGTDINSANTYDGHQENIMKSDSVSIHQMDTTYESAMPGISFSVVSSGLTASSGGAPYINDDPYYRLIVGQWEYCLVSFRWNVVNTNDMNTGFEFQRATYTIKSVLNGQNVMDVEFLPVIVPKVYTDATIGALGTVALRQARILTYQPPKDYSRSLQFEPSTKTFFYVVDQMQIVTVDFGSVPTDVCDASWDSGTTAMPTFSSVTVTPNTAGDNCYIVDEFKYIFNYVYFRIRCYKGGLSPYTNPNYDEIKKASPNFGTITLIQSFRASNKIIPNLATLQNYGLIYNTQTFNAANFDDGLWLTKLDSTSGDYVSGPTVHELNDYLAATTYTTDKFKIFQVNMKTTTDFTPTYAIRLGATKSIYRITEFQAILVTTSTNDDDYWNYPIIFGRYSTLSEYPNACGVLLSALGNTYSTVRFVFNNPTLLYWQCYDDPAPNSPGNGILDPATEECDTGGDGQGCDPSGKIMPGWTCITDPASARSVCSKNQMGDGYIDFAAGEQCDDVSI